MNVTALPFAPYWDARKLKDENGEETEVYTGSDYLMIQAIGKALNFEVKVMPSANWDEVVKILDI